jgi:hypothetical protein
MEATSDVETVRSTVTTTLPVAASEYHATPRTPEGPDAVARRGEALGRALGLSLTLCGSCGRRCLEQGQGRHQRDECGKQVQGFEVSGHEFLPRA